MKAYKVLNRVRGELYSANPTARSIEQFLDGSSVNNHVIVHYPEDTAIQPLNDTWLFVFAEMEWAKDWADTKEQEIWEVEADQLQTPGQVGMHWIKQSFPPPGTHFCKELRLIRRVQ